MRTLLALALVLAACGPSDRSTPGAAHDAPSAARNRGPDPLVLRVPRAGGRARVHAYPRLDSLLWSAPGAPPLADVLGFDPDHGIIAYVDQGNAPGRIDLRQGDVSRIGGKVRLVGARTADGASIYGLTAGKGVRFTTTGRWDVEATEALSAVFPQNDGALISMSRRRAGAATLWRVFPPETKVLDSVTVRGLRDGPQLQGGDRIYLASDDGFAVVQARTLEAAAPVELDGRVRDAVATPSGDRLFIAVEGEREIQVHDRYRNRLGPAVELPGEVRALRIDPLGRYLLARPAEGDSAWVVALGTLKHVGTVHTRWLTDLPFVAHDGAVATAQGQDVVFVDGTTMREAQRVRGGAGDFWFPFHWNGFRPRAAGLDRPVEFSVGTSDSAADSSLAAAAAAADTAGAPADTVSPAPAPAAQPAPGRPARQEWLVSFAAVLSEGTARALAEQIVVDGTRARVLTAMRDDTPVYRVVLGPYADRDAAERAGRASNRPYWVYAAPQP